MPELRIITRSEWGALFGTGDLDAGPEPRVVIHHSYKPALDALASQTDEEAAVRSIERFHVHSNGWQAIGYNFLVAPSGRIYEGRGWKYRGSHAGPVNGSSIGICLLIDGSQTPASAEAVQAVRSLIAEGLRLDELAANYLVSGHRDHMNRTCPGDKVYAQLPSFRHDAEVEVPHITPETTHSGPQLQPALNLERITVPRREHVAEIIRVRGLAPEAAEAGLAVAEVLLRAVLRGAEEAAEDRAKDVADAVADWIKERAA